MASKTYITLEDDVDGSEADETIEFGLDGTTFEIDLNTEHAQQLREALAVWIEHARRIGGRRNLGKTKIPSQRSSITPVQSVAATFDRQALQKYARTHGLKVPAERGRISGDLMQAWESAGRPT